MKQVNLTKSLVTVVDNLKSIVSDLPPEWEPECDLRSTLTEQIISIESVLIWFSVLKKKLKSAYKDTSIVRSEIACFEDEDATVLFYDLEEVLDKLNKISILLTGGGVEL